MTEKYETIDGLFVISEENDGKAIIFTIEVTPEYYRRLYTALARIAHLLDIHETAGN